MRPSQVRRRILDDHTALRRRLEEIEELAKGVAADERHHVGGLRARAEELLRVLSEHMYWEDRHLAPALEDADAWGPERARLLEQDHRDQRSFLADVVERLQDQQQPPPLLATKLLDLVGRLRADMEEEEGFFLDPDVLRDDVIGVNVEAG
jgi:iron-sulfur cluster repair protein YtfE (RIC family)